MFTPLTRVFVVLFSFTAANWLSERDIVNHADFWTGVAGALIGCALAFVLVDMVKD